MKITLVPVPRQPDVEIWLPASEATMLRKVLGGFTVKLIQQVLGVDEREATDIYQLTYAIFDRLDDEHF